MKKFSILVGLFIVLGSNQALATKYDFYMECNRLENPNLAVYESTSVWNENIDTSVTLSHSTYYDSNGEITGLGEPAPYRHLCDSVCLVVKGPAAQSITAANTGVKRYKATLTAMPNVWTWSQVSNYGTADKVENPGTDTRKFCWISKWPNGTMGAQSERFQNSKFSIKTVFTFKDIANVTHSISMVSPWFLDDQIPII
jgi:hypothetical protein